MGLVGGLFAAGSFTQKFPKLIPSKREDTLTIRVKMFAVALCVSNSQSIPRFRNMNEITCSQWDSRTCCIRMTLHNLLLHTQVFERMQTTGMRPSVVHYTIYLKGICGAGNMATADALLATMEGETPPAPFVPLTMLPSCLCVWWRRGNSTVGDGLC